MKNDATLKLRVPQKTLEEWRQKASESGRSLSSWIRGQCDGSRNGLRAGIPSVPAPSPKGPEEDRCEHGRDKFNCEVWGCKFYFVPGARGVNREVHEPQNLPRTRELPLLERRTPPTLFAPGNTEETPEEGIEPDPRNFDPPRDRPTTRDRVGKRTRGTRSSIASLKKKIDKIEKCPHGFIRVDGKTVCPNCR